MLQKHDVVALTQDRAVDGLRTGDVGAVVHRYADSDAYEVEFVDERGRSKCVVTVNGAAIMKLNLLSLSV